MVLGLTGGIACGKTTLAEALAQQGWKVVETDQIAHDLMKPGAENYQKVIDLFGPGILNPDQTVNRRALGELVFSEPSLRQKLNQAVHPAIRHAWQSQIESILSVDPAHPVVIVIPLLFELQLASEFEATACVGCRSERQWHRLRQRGLTETQARQRLHSQQSLFEKMRAAHYVMWNEGSVAALGEQARLLPR